MHPYATDSKERLVVPVLLAALAIPSAYGLSKLVVWLELQDRLWWLDMPSVWGFYVLYWGLFDRWLWRWRMLSCTGLVRVPDLNGHWKGQGLSSYVNESGERTNFNILDVEIRQRWTRLAVWFRAEESRSLSLIGAVMVDQGQHPTLSYEYRNEPGQHAAETMHAHPGMARVELISANELEGEYYKLPQPACRPNPS